MVSQYRSKPWVRASASLAIFMALGLLLSACSPAATPAPTDTVAAVAAATDTAMPAATDTAAVTSTPAVTDTPSGATNTPAVTDTPSGATDTPAVPATGGSTVMVANDAKLGKILVDAKGMTLYTYKNDTAGTSTCTGTCATNWPPLAVTSTPTGSTDVTGKLDVITRADGTKQVTYNGMPLYYFAKDAKAGDTTGNGVGSVWSVVTIQ